MNPVWAYVAGAYVVTASTLLALGVATLLHLRHWSARAREEEERR